MNDIDIPKAAFLSIDAPHGASWEFLLLFGVVLLGPIIVQRAKVPGLIGLILGGFVIGPHGLGFISSGNTTIPDIGQLGLLYLMFVAGVELDLGLFRAHLKRAVTFASFTFSLPLVLGFCVGQLIGYSFEASLLLGSLVASHTLLTYPMVRAAGLAANPAVAAAVGATVIADTAALVILAGVAGTVGGEGSTAEILVQVGIGLVVLSFATLWLLPRISGWLLRNLGTERAVRYLIALCAFLGAATLADMVGIEGIVGAFFAGLALNRLVPNRGPLMDRVEFFGSTVFVPIFLVSVGLILEPAVMVEPKTVVLALLVTAACMLGKAGAAALAVPVLGYTRPEAHVMFALTFPQAAATLAASMVGFQIGLFGTTFVNAMLIVILISVVISTVASGRAIPKVERPVSDDRPLGEQVLVATERFEHLGSALLVASRIVERDAGAATVVQVCDPTERDEDRAEVETLEAGAHRAGLDAQAMLMIHRSFARGVLNAAITVDAGLVLAAEPGASAGRAVGGWADAVGEVAPMPVAIMHGSVEEIGEVRVNGLGEAGDVGPVTLELANRMARGTAASVVAKDLAQSLAELPVNGVLVASIHSWDLLAGLPEPPPDRLLVAVREPLPTSE